MYKSPDNRGLVFILPAVSFFAIFIAYPALYTFYASFFQWNGVSDGAFVGFDNYVKMFAADRAFYVSLRNAAYWAFFTIIPQMVIGFVLAIILSERVPAGTIYRTIFYLPVVVSPVVVGIVWQRIYNPYGGLLSDLGQTLSLPILQQPFLTDYKTAIFSVIAVNVWQWTGFSMVLYLAGLQSIPREMLEAAGLEGATRWQVARQIIWPNLKHVHLSLILIGVVGTMQTFPLIFVLTQGGPNHATEMLPNYIFQQAFRQQATGYACSMSVVLLVLCVLLSLLQMKYFGARFSLGK